MKMSEANYFKYRYYYICKRNLKGNKKRQRRKSQSNPKILHATGWSKASWSEKEAMRTSSLLKN